MTTPLSLVRIEYTTNVNGFTAQHSEYVRTNARTFSGLSRALRNARHVPGIITSIARVSL